MRDTLTTGVMGIPWGWLVKLRRHASYAIAARLRMPIPTHRLIPKRS